MYKIMRVPEKGKVADTQSLTSSFNGNPYKVDFSYGFSICASITDSTDADGDTFVSGVLAEEEWTFQAVADTDPGDNVVFYDHAGLAWGFALNVSGTDPAVTNPAYLAVPSGRRVFVDISALTTAADVAAAVETAINALTGFTGKFTTDDTAADGTMLVARDTRGPVTEADSYNTTGAGAGTVAILTTAAGVVSDVDLDADTLAIDNFDPPTGLKIRLTTSGSLPTGLATATDYYVINVSTGIFQLASSLANANNGVEIDLTGFGTGTHTVDVQDALAGTIKLQASNNAFDDNVFNGVRSDAIWIDIPNMTATLDGGNDLVFWNVSDVYYEAVRVVWTRTTGAGSALIYLVAKGDG